jgi:hypothetical protein
VRFFHFHAEDGTMSLTILDRTWSGATAWMIPRGVTVEVAGAVIGSFLDVVATSTGKATHYNTEAEIRLAELAAHAAMLRLDRRLYAALLLVPGVTDRSMQLGVRNLLATRVGSDDDWLPQGMDRSILRRLVATLPPQRVLRLFASLGVQSELPRVNNARTRKLVLRTLLASGKLELWAVKYRSKLARALTHAVGKRTAGILRSILGKAPEDRTPRETAILRKEIGRFVPESQRLHQVYECVGFVLGARPPARELAMLRRFDAAKTDLAAGEGSQHLPPQHAVVGGPRAEQEHDVCRSTNGRAEERNGDRRRGRDRSDSLRCNQALHLCIRDGDDRRDRGRARPQGEPVRSVGAVQARPRHRVGGCIAVDARR